MNSTRRRLVVGAGAALALGAGCAAALTLMKGPRQWLVHRVITRYVPGIVFDGDDLARFTDEVDRLVLDQRIGWRGVMRYGGASMLRDWPGASSLFAPVETQRDLDQRIVDAFFRATDFWEAPYWPCRRITMIRSPDPYVSRCSNPLAELAPTDGLG